VDQGPPDPGSPDDSTPRTELLRLRGALFDPNTELYSAPALLESVRGLFQRTRTVGVVHLEIDPQGRVEAVYGWQVLDGLLRTVAQELRLLAGGSLPADAFVCQSGIYSERFLIFAPIARGDQGSPSGYLGRTCRGIQEHLEKRFAGIDFRSMAPRPTLAIGSAVISEHPFYRLERQIYRATEEASLSASREESRERGRQHVELKRIIREQNIEILFQPILHLESETIIGYEAFARGPRDTVFETPRSLFAYSREVGMSAELDLMCQRTVLRQARRLAAGDKLFLNALPASLLDPGFREGLLGDLPEGFPIAREDIVLDIGDMNSIEDYKMFDSEVTDLRSRGIGMSIDDVGRGASSLENISEMGPDFIKVDNAMVRNIDKSMIKQEIVRSLCQAAVAMDAVVIAEGIETREELATVMRCGATHGQGYLFYRPSRELPAMKARRQEM
jgi:EAL domain-containing protein (putative c-di-GMP-specific phosphodiesterase class I)